ncbi:MAG: extracellular solute-binding protein [Limnochordales bacterium]|nr:extracellular solute-binding protein [Limnochordales bacterium]
MTARSSAGWSWARLVRGAASVTAYALIGVALARLAVAIDSQPTLVREALQVGLQTLSLDNPGRHPAVLPAASEKLQSQPAPVSTKPPEEPSLSLAAQGNPASTRPLVLWEYRLPSWGEVVFKPDGTPVATGNNRFEEAVAAAVQEFQERNPQIDVKVVWFAEGEVISELARAATGAAELPDLVALPGATIAHPQAMALARFLPATPNDLPVVRQAVRLAAGAARSFSGEEGPWVVPRWLEWQAWVGSQTLWQKLGLDSERVIRSGWQWRDVTEAVRKSVGSGSTSGGSARAGVYLFPTAWMFAGLLTASDRPIPYTWQAGATSRWLTELRSGSADNERVELRWDEKFLYQLAQTWQEWTRQARPRPYSNSTVSGWLVAANAGALVVGGPVGPTLTKYLAGRLIGPARDTQPAAKLLFLPVPTPAAGVGAVVPVRISGYQILAGGKFNTSSGQTRDTNSQPDSNRIRLAAELALILARHVGAWAVREYGFLPVDAGSAGDPRAVPSYAPAGLAALLQAPPRLAAGPLLPPAYAQAMDQALDELARSAPELAAGRSDPATVTERLLRILQTPTVEARPAD